VGTAAPRRPVGHRRLRDDAGVVQGQVIDDQCGTIGIEVCRHEFLAFSWPARVVDRWGERCSLASEFVDDLRREGGFSELDVEKKNRRPTLTLGSEPEGGAPW
jgi:hypothetical protein